MSSDASTTVARHMWQVWWLGYLVVVGGGFVIAAFARRRFTEPYIGLTLGLFLLVLLGWLIRPRVALYLTIFLTAVSDSVTISWFPFVKNFSSRESISYIADAVVVSPLDVSLFVGFSFAAMRQYARTGRLMPPSPLTRPIAVFTMFVVYGFFRGVVLLGGDARIAVFEGRALFYLLLVFGIAINVCTEPEHFRYAMWWLLSGVLVQSLLSVQFFSTLDPATKAATESLSEHGAAIGQNLLILAVLSLVLFRARASRQRVMLFAALVPTTYVYLLSQRRAGVAAFAVGFLFLLGLLFWRRRTLFWFVAPTTALITIAYLGAFWNSSGLLGFPAQAIKSIVAPEAATVEDQNSDLYRIMESFNLVFTIRTSPLFGLGFGQAFYQPIPLPAITQFDLSAYMPHNSILWFWIKTGFGGFASMMYLFGKTVMLGTRRARRLPDGIDVVVAQLGLLFVVMFALFTYVDISWDARNMVMLGLAAAICAQPLPPSRPEAAEPIDEVQVPRSRATSRATAATAAA